MNYTNFLNEAIIENINIHKKLPKLEKELTKTVNLIYRTIHHGKKVYLCGNGGSAADAQHLAAEFLIRLRPNVNRKPYPVLSLAQDTSTLTACGNDYSFSKIFVRNFQALATKGDLLFVISTSGMSQNIIEVCKFAKKNNFKIIGLLGKKGGKVKKYCYTNLIVESNNTARIQECHIFLGHLIFEKVEDLLIGNT